MKHAQKITLIVLSATLIVESILLGVLFLENNDLRDQLDEHQITAEEKIEQIENVGTSLFEIETNAINSVEKKPKPIEELYMTGWIPDWDFVDGFDSLKDNSTLFDSVSPFRYSLKEDGSFELLEAGQEGADESKYPELLEFSENAGIDVIPSFTNFSEVTMTKVLNDETAFKNQIENMVNFVVENEYDGLDLDYESVLLSDREKYFDFLKELGKKLAENEKIFSITLLPKWGEETTVYTAFPQTRKVFDYNQLAEIADQIRIMAYDYTSRFTDYYGPNSPKSWVEDIIKYAIAAGVPRDKLIIALPTYSFIYDASLEKLPEVNYRYSQQVTSTGKFPPGLAVYPKFVEEIKQFNEYTEERENNWGENVLFYTNTEDEEKVIIYPTQQSIDERKQIAADYGIKGVSFWRLGDEGDLEY